MDRPLPAERSTGRARIRSALTHAGGAAARAGDWVHYVAVGWMAFETGGASMVAIYFFAVGASSFLLDGRFRGRWLAALLTSFLGPAAWIGLFLQSEVTASMLAAAGVLAGASSAASGRPSAFTAGLNSAPGWAGLVGVGAALALVVSGWAELLLPTAACLVAGGLLLGERHAVGLSLPGVLFASSGSAAALGGIRTLEPLLVGLTGGVAADRVSAAGFALAWAAGLEMGWRRAGAADARIVLGAPFAAAAALAGLGVAPGPGSLFLWAGAGGLAGLVLGTGSRSRSGRIWPGGRGWLLPPAFAAAAWSAWWWDWGSSEIALSGAAAAVLLGGFVSLAAAKRAARHRVGAARHRVEVAKPTAPLPQTPPVAPSGSPSVAPLAVALPVGLGERDVKQAVSDLRRSRVTARALRRQVLEEFQRSRNDPLSEARRAILEVIDGLEKEARRLKLPTR